MFAPWTQALAIAGATLVSEDLTSIAVGVLVGQGRLDLAFGIAACAVGIFAGDLGLWLLGRVAVRGGRAIPGAERLARLAACAPLDRASRALDRHLGAAILVSRFVPGTRLPLYLAAGMLGRRPWVFAAWTALSISLWVPFLILAVATFGAPLVEAVETWLQAAWLAVPVVALTGLACHRAALGLSRPTGRARLGAAISRVSRWEFWPMWLFYAPVLPWIVWLAARHGGLGTLAASNPGMADGGFVGESKSEILATLPARWTLPAFLLEPGPADARMAALERGLCERGWTYPVVLKPDTGQRGAGVTLVSDADAACLYFQQTDAAVIAQQFHPGPFEAGIFYYRRPGETRGHIFSITDKRFPHVVGDGHSTVTSLIWRHPRYRMQAVRFFSQLGDGVHAVPARGASVSLTFAGNHSRGSMFLDGEHLRTPALEARIDQIARAVPGFFVGRFDVRYSNVEAFKAGRDLAIVELNGATSESTNIYDPARSLLSAYRTLYAQWRIIFEIGAANRRLGHPGASLRRLGTLAFAYLTARHGDAASNRSRSEATWDVRSREPRLTPGCPGATGRRPRPGSVPVS